MFAPARIPGFIPVGFAGLRLRPLRRLPIAYGWLSKKPIERDAEDSYVLPMLTRGEIRRDVRRVLAGLDPKYTLDAAARLTAFDKPVLIAWSTDDRFFPRSTPSGWRNCCQMPGSSGSTARARSQPGGPAGAARRADRIVRAGAGGGLSIS